jgi:hypothetical protein
MLRDIGQSTKVLEHFQLKICSILQDWRPFSLVMYPGPRCTQKIRDARDMHIAVVLYNQKHQSSMLYFVCMILLDP